eukprot:CAMPEP_0119009282 /NCGR_PEP_ID=MMETSP1176-20130426/4256_1 /TAXON_ID=265551 /ORGANISM="Synedropsis recta cf, Strain CCMP1620" /LENGTH=269 /DNA_ID=CAMNT_0006961757 /DNA_START=178 /DNA_END=987 /DNA_ORIENTATION=-
MVSNATQQEHATYSMAFDDVAVRQPSTSKRRHRRGAPSDGDDNGSLTYSSAGSSINSGASSAAGESTDSSFSDIMRVLALQEGPELEALMKKEGLDPRTIAKVKAKAAGDNSSVASSLNYSTDGESALNGECVITTITGQPSDSHGHDGGGLGLVQEGGPMTENIVFAPADPIDRKHRKGSRSSRSSSRSKQAKEKESKSNRPKPQPVPIGSPIRPRVRPSTAHPGTPPPAPRRGLELNESRCDEDSLWYAKWWMCGFTDALRDLVPKR